MVLNKMVKVLNWSNLVATNLCDLKIDCGCGPCVESLLRCRSVNKIFFTFNSHLPPKWSPSPAKPAKTP